jgi:hypothetical protein
MLRWPECGFKFFSRFDKEHWRRCNEPWGHWILRGERGKHAGPVLCDRPHKQDVDETDHVPGTCRGNGECTC